MRQIIRLISSLTLSFYLGLILLFFPGVLHASEQEAIFAGGCFWCLEHDLEDLSGVSSVESGYSGGSLPNPTYRDHQGHQEAVLVRFNPSKISYQKLLRSYWRNVDPLDGGGQFCDRGNSYRPVIFVRDDNQRKDAIQSLEFAANELGEQNDSIKLEIKDFKKFWIAEDYHQNFAKLNSLKYNFYRYSCGRDKRLEEIWGQEARTNEKWRGGEQI